MPDAVAEKRALEDLAIFGGTPAFAETLHVGRPNQGDRAALLRRIEGMLDRNWLTNNGPLVQEFESRIASMVGVRHCVATCNATVALEIAIRALGLRGEVIVPSFTFVATAHALQWQEIQPVFCDIDPATHCIDPAEVERHITPRTTGIIGVHLWGRTCDVEALQEIADRRGLALLFDAAHAFGASRGGRMVGSFGRCEVFSFHATKFLNTFEGGAVVTDDSDLAEKVRLMRNFGFAGLDRAIYIGTNGKMPEVCAAMGLTSLDASESFIETNRANYHAYREFFAGLPGVRMLEYDEADRCTFQYIVTEIEPEFGVARDDVVRVLHAENVRARRYFWPGCHRMEPYRSFFPHAGMLVPRTELIARRVLVLPTGCSVTRDTIGRIRDVFDVIARHPQEIDARLRRVETAPLKQQWFAPSPTTSDLLPGDRTP